MDYNSIRFFGLFGYFLCLSFLSMAQPGNTGNTDAEFSTGRACIRKAEGQIISVDKVQSTIINQLGKVEFSYFDMKANLVVLNPLDSISAGYCPVILKQKYATRQTINTPQTISLDQVYLSYSITNEGFAPVIIMTSGGIPSTLYTGGTTQCEASWDDALQRVVYCPPIDIIVPQGGLINYYHRAK